MKTISIRLTVLIGLMLWSLVSVQGALATAPSLSLTVNPAPPGGTTTATVAILNASDVESLSLELNFSSGTSLQLPASGWFTRGDYFPSTPFGSASTVELNNAVESVARTRIFLDGFKPTGTSGNVGTVTFTVNPGAVIGDTQVLSLSGQYLSKSGQSVASLVTATAVFTAGTYPNVIVNPPSKSFGSVSIGSQSTTQTFTIGNSGSGDLLVSNVTLTGTNYTEFTKLSDNCSGKTVTQGNTCTVGVAFAPTSAGMKLATLSIASNDPDTPNMGVQLLGNDVYTLTFTKAGTGNGSVLSTPAGIACNTNCSAQFDGGTQVILHATAETYSLFNSWTNACTGTGDCTVVMSTDRSVTGTFDKDTAHLVRIDGIIQSYFSSILSALSAAGPGDTIKAWGTDFTENLNLNKVLIFKGGYNVGYTSNSGMTTLKGTLTVTNGSLTVENLQIQ